MVTGFAGKHPGQPDFHIWPLGLIVLVWHIHDLQHFQQPRPELSLDRTNGHMATTIAGISV